MTKPPLTSTRTAGRTTASASAARPRPGTPSPRPEGPGPLDGPPGTAIVRAVAVCLVGYSYLVALWAVRHGHPATWLVDGVREWLGTPLGLGEDFGFLGLALLLVLLGLVLPASAVAGGARALLVPAVLRGYPPLAVAVTVSAVALALGGQPLTDPAPAHATVRAYLVNLLLVQHVVGGTSLVALSWVVATGALFCLLVVAVLPLLRRNAEVALAVQLAVVAVVVLTGNRSTGDYRHVALLVSFLPFPVFGELVWAVRARRAGPWTAGLLGFSAWWLLVLAARGYPELGPWWYPLAAGYAVLGVLLALRSGAWLERAAVVRWLAGRCYPLVLLQAALGYAVLGPAAQWLPPWAAVPIAAAVTAGGAEVCHRVVVLPARRLAARLPAAAR